MRLEIGDGVRLFVDVDGAGWRPAGPELKEQPTILLLHGGPGLDHSHYKLDRRDPLTDIAQLVYYDHRGNGRSDRRSPAEWNLDTWADDVVRLCDALAIERPVVLGTSFGGFVAQRYLARHPDHPAKVILAVTGATIDIDVMADAFARFGGTLAAETARSFFSGDDTAMPAFMEHCMPLYSTAAVDPDLMQRAVMNPELFTGFFQGEGRNMDLRAGLTAARCPVLVVGAERDPVMPVAVVEQLAASLPPEVVRLEMLPGISHLDAGTGNPAFAALIRDFVLS